MSIDTVFSELTNVSLGSKDTFSLHNLSLSGLPKAALSSVCEKLGMSEKEFLKVFHVAAPKKTDSELSSSISDAVIRVVQAVALLQAKTGWDTAACGSWLKSPCPALRGRIPLMLLATSMGCEYAQTAISRL